MSIVTFVELMRMSNNKMQIFPSDVMAEAINKLPRGTKSKFVNLCVECVLADTSLRNKVLAQLMGFDLSNEVQTASNEAVNQHTKAEVDGDEIQQSSTTVNPKKITPETIRFK